MTKYNSLKVITVVSLAGVLFSGFLTYKELFTGGCDLGIVYCGSNTGNIAGLPACVYGLIMYLIVLAVSLLGLRSKK